METVNEQLNSTFLPLPNFVAFLESKANGNVKQLAEEVNIARSTLVGYINGKPPTIENIIKICLFYNVSADFLLGLEGGKHLFDVGEAASEICHVVERYSDTYVQELTKDIIMHIMPTIQSAVYNLRIKGVPAAKPNSGIRFSMKQK